MAYIKVVIVRVVLAKGNAAAACYITEMLACAREVPVSVDISFYREIVLAKPGKTSKYL